MANVCLLPNARIRELSKALIGETDDTITGLVSLWQETNNKNIDEYPTKKELAVFRYTQRTKFPLVTIISGGQTGVDRLGLEVGKQLNITTGGTAAPGFYTTEGRDTSLADFGLVEIDPKIQSEIKNKKEFYLPRTRENVRNSDGTVYFSTKEDSAGFKATKKFAVAAGKPFLQNPNAAQLRRWIISNGIKVLNVAGNRNLSPEERQIVQKILIEAFTGESMSDEEQFYLNSPIMKESEVLKKRIEVLEKLLDTINNGNLSVTEEAKNLYESIIATDKTTLDSINKGQRKEEEINIDNFNEVLNKIKDVSPKNTIDSFIKELQDISENTEKSHEETNNTIGENISSKGSALAKKLTNVGNNLKVNYKGTEYENSEHAYQTWKSGTFNQEGYDAKGGKVKSSLGNTLAIMIDIITHKLQQHPELMEEIKEAGGYNYLINSTHDVSHGDRYWQTKKGKGGNNFIFALSEAYIRAGGERNAPKMKRKEIEGLSEVFNVSEIATLEDQAAVDLDFDPKTRRARTKLIARFFSNEVDNLLKQTEELLKKRIENSTNPLEKEQLLDELKSLNRFTIIKTYTPAGIFDKVLQLFYDYVSASPADRNTAEFKKILNTKGSEKYSSEKKLTAAQKIAAYKYEAYKKIVNNFKALAEEASTSLVMTEGIRIDPNSADSDTNSIIEENDSNTNVLEERVDETTKEETVKDGWMTNYREVSSHESLSQAVRKVINEIPRLNYKGFYEKDDLGFQIFLDADYVHATLIDKLKNMITSEDMIPLLQELSKQKPWVKQIITLLENDDALFSQFYQDFRKDFINYWVQKKKLLSNGSYKMETIAINRPEGIYYLLDAWRDNHENGIQLDDDSVYEINGDLNIENAEKGLKWIKTLNNTFNNLTTEQRLELLEQDKYFNSIVKLLKMLGIEPNLNVLKMALTNIQKTEGVTYTDPIMLLLPSLNVIYSNIAKGEIKSETLEDGTTIREDLINTFGGAFNTIALMMAEVTEDAIESSFRQNNKTYYSHVTPNYLGKLVKQLKNVMSDPARYDKFIEEEFKKYEWFFKNGWKNDWLEQLATNEEMRKGFDHKVVLSSDKVDYTNWDSIDYTVALLTEYWGNPDDSRHSTKWAWYHIPILSDAPSAEFLRFRKYTNEGLMDAEGNFITYDKVIIEKLTKLVNQEYDRIMLVINRDEEHQKGNTNIAPITNYDIVRDSEGKVKSVGGAEFKFLPELNNLTYENGEIFLQKLGRLKEGNGGELRTFIESALYEIMETGFDKTYQEWYDMGLLDITPEGRYKHLPFESALDHNKKVSANLIKIKELLGLKDWTSDMEKVLVAFNNNLPVNDVLTTKVFENIKQILNTKAADNSIFQTEASNLTKILYIKNNAKNALREYYWNSKLATSQIIQLTTTDLAFYKNIEDFQKRYKEIHSPALRLNTKAMYKGQRIGRDVERTIYLKDEEIMSHVIDDIQDVLDAKVISGEISKMDRDNMLNKFKKINVTDAQAYRSISSYRAILGMSGQWTDEMQTAFDNFKNGNWNIADFNMVWQTKKPFVYTQIDNDSGIAGHTGIKTPVQHKNSEFLLLAMHTLIAGSLGKSSRLAALNEFMETNNIDVIQFESTTKVGKQGVVDINNVNKDSVIPENETQAQKEARLLAEKQAIIEALTNAVKIGEQENPNVVHKISYEDYGIQTATPEHLVDTVQLVGTQIRKLITADISEDAIIEVDGNKMTKQEWLNLYNAINTENIIDSFASINKIFKDPKKVEKLLLEEIRGNQRYGIEMLRACTLNEHGQFNIPLFDPVQSQRVQTLLNSIIKSRVTKQKIKGGSLILVSDFGLTDELNIVFEGEGKNKKIKYLECYMPAYTRAFFEPLMKDGTHELDINKLPEDLRKLIGYRVPTEDKYSMAPLYIKGFLPQQNGSSIMLPADITTIAGSDFDVDKLYIMLPEFRISKKYDMAKAWEDFYSDKSNNNIVEEIEENYTKGYHSYLEESPKNTMSFDNYKRHIKNMGIKNNQLSINAKKQFNEWFKSRKNSYIEEQIIEKIKYDYNKKPEENSREARNNAMIDLMWGVLTNEDTIAKILNPGGFDSQKKAERIISILNNTLESDLRKELGINDKASIMDALMSKSLEYLSSLAERNKKVLDPLSPLTQIILHQQNMTGAKLIGIYANHNANHALMQHTDLVLSDKHGSFILNGKKLTSLHRIKNDENEIISKNNAGFLAASVDNVKDPVLAGLNQNTFTADLTMFLSRLGYNTVEIGLFLNQPIVIEITKKFFRESREGKYKDTIISEVIEEYKKKASSMSETSYENYKNNEFKIDDLAKNILIAKEMYKIKDKNSTSDLDKVVFYERQVAVAFLFKRIMKSSDALSELVQATRADTQRGAAGPTIADSKIKMQKLYDFIESMESLDFPLVGAFIIHPNIDLNADIDTLRQEFLNKKLPYLQAFYSLGLEATEKMLSKYFPQYTPGFDEVINTIRGKTKANRLDVKTMNSIYNDLLVYIMSQTEFFGAEMNIDQLNSDLPATEKISAETKRSYFINHFPEYFKRVVEDNPEIGKLEFIKRLKRTKYNQYNPVDTVIFKNVGQLSHILKERYMRDWTTLLYMQNPEAAKLALNLFRYSFYRNGFAFGSQTFIHLAPLSVRNAIPNYIQTLREILDNKESYEEFVDQYMYNHLDNRKLVPEIPDKTTVNFLDEEKNPLDKVTFVIEDNSSYNDKKVLIKVIEGTFSKQYMFHEYIAKRYRGGYIYYKLTDERASESNVGVYKKIEPLGFKNSFIEYEFGKNVTELSTVIPKRKNNSRMSNQSIENFLAETDITMSEEDMKYFEISEAAYTLDALQESMLDTISKALGFSDDNQEAEAPKNVPESITNIPPNTEYLDANDDTICKTF